MKRVLCILSGLYMGGAETFLMKVSRELPTDQYQFDFIVSAENEYYTQEVLQRGGLVTRVLKMQKNMVERYLAGAVYAV